MCRNIKKLRQPESLPSDEELQLAALQFVRKVSGYRAPSRRNAAAFDDAVQEIADSTRRLLQQLTPSPARPTLPVLVAAQEPTSTHGPIA